MFRIALLLGPPSCRNGILMLTFALGVLTGFGVGFGTLVAVGRYVEGEGTFLRQREYRCRVSRKGKAMVTFRLHYSGSAVGFESDLFEGI